MPASATNPVPRLLIYNDNAELVSLVFRFTVIWESIIVIIREKRAKVIEIIWERVEPRAA